MDEAIKRLAAAINAAQEICVFTGAGISCPSGIPDFRSADGLYNSEGMGRYTPEEIISHSFFVAHPDMFYEFYKSKMMYPDAKPNDWRGEHHLDEGFGKYGDASTPWDERIILYLKAQGINDAEIEAVRAIMLEPRR